MTFQEIRQGDQEPSEAQRQAVEQTGDRFEQRMKVARLLESLRAVIDDDFEIVVRLKRAPIKPSKFKMNEAGDISFVRLGLSNPSSWM
jgi:hypothetical protein